MTRSSKKPPKKAPKTGKPRPRPARGADRPAGRPAAAQTVFTPEVSLQVERWWAEAMPYTEIARRLGCDWTAVREHIRQHVMPRWREMESCQRETLEAQVAHMQRVALAKFEESTEPQTRRTIERALTKEGGGAPQVVKRVLTKISRTGEVCWWQVIQWCIDWKTRVGGHYAATKLQIGGLRSAGVPPEEHQREMLEKLRGIYRKAMEGQAGTSRGDRGDRGDKR